MIEEDKFTELYKKIARVKADILFEEPCPMYECDEEYWEDFSYVFQTD